ncbi:MAG: tRNA (guanosine(46)-N7)-methyltransferase TrmB [Lachnospiraceae bacterium]|nr:tRNA (guanosine(46)-N7)-methyltransferase TrmB [Lachnospiraceae bacterium]
MRLRNITGSREMIAESQYVVQEPEQYKGRWKEFFGNENPIHIEIGMGKGKFLTTLALQNPDINYIGIEKYSSVLLRATQKREEMEECTNLYFLRYDAEEILRVFDKDEVDRIYLNFSDPWPKDRHAKRRLTSKEFLKRYNEFLVPDGKVIFKSDNRMLFDFTLEQAAEARWQTSEVTYDLHHSEYVEGNVMTEYEEKFSAQGNPIHRVVLTR